MSYDPKHCVECGFILTDSTVRSVGLDINGRAVYIPGLYRCMDCQRLMDMGVISSNITHEEALGWLAAMYIPQAATVLMLADPRLSGAHRAILITRVADAVDIAHELAALLGGDGPQDQEQEEVTLSPAQRVLASIEIGDDMRATYECPGCHERHDVERLFEIIEEHKRPEADAA